MTLCLTRLKAFALNLIISAMDRSQVLMMKWNNVLLYLRQEGYGFWHEIMGNIVIVRAIAVRSK